LVCVDDVLLELWLDELLVDDESCAIATVPSTSIAAGNIIHFETLLLMTVFSFESST
jgi:hypothetical protein